jgi:predicted O-methyltransferase YrrM
MINVVNFTRAFPKSSMVLRRIHAALSHKPYFFNRQKMRAQVFAEIDKKIVFENYVETGTYLGITTYFLAVTAHDRHAKVYSCEISDDFFAIAGRTAGDFSNVRLHHGDSVDFLRLLSQTISGATNFIYLDAHWHDYLPLKDELSLVKHWHNSVVMIDDFKVPFDRQFGWDKYDEQREICMEYIDGSYGDGPVYFPSYSAPEEGVAARGYCVIAMSQHIEQRLDTIKLLRKLEI